SGAKVTLLPSSFSSSGTTGFSEYLGLTLPSGRPRWDMSTTALAPLSMAYLMVGTAPTMRCGLVMFLSPSRGTLKSTCERAHVSFWDVHYILQRMVEWTYAHQDAFALEVDILDRELVGKRHLDGQTEQLA